MATAVEETTAAGGSPSEEIKPYQIHVSSRYLDLTKEKLEITRLPHELPNPKSEDWWEPKPQIEPLIDFWLEEYSWRTQEDELNAQLPQFRTGFVIPQNEALIRLHFIHIRSKHFNALPLLMIPPFPFTNLSFGHIIKAFTDPEDETSQAFHLVIPSLPGLGFSDALPNNTPVISTSGDMLDSLMARLDYPHYLATNMGSGSASPAEIDWQLANYLAIHYPDTCLGVHFISPPLAQPKLQEAPLEWAKWSLASFLKVPMLGYLTEDFTALARSRPAKKATKNSTATQFGLNQLGLREPNTLAYALCDSPTGLLVFALKSLQLLGPKREFTPKEIITFTQLAWLPGPEAAMRYWAYCLQHPEVFMLAKKATPRPKVAITVFLGDESEEAERDLADQPANSSADVEEQRPKQVQPDNKDGYACPSWANAKYQVVYTHRANGKSGLLAWERPELVVSGVRGLAKAVLRLDARLKPSVPETVPLQQVVAGVDATAENTNDDGSATTTTTPASVPVTSLQPPTPGPGALGAGTTDGLLAPIPEERGQPHREISEETRVASDAEEQESHLKAKSDDTLAGTSPDVKPLDSPIHSS